VGRWISVDPEEQYFDFFLFAGNNPINLKDPNGAEVTGTEEQVTTFANACNEAVANNNPVADEMINIWNSTTKVSFEILNIAPENWAQNQRGVFQNLTLSVLNGPYLFPVIYHESHHAFQRIENKQYCIGEEVRAFQYAYLAGLQPVPYDNTTNRNWLGWGNNFSGYWDRATYLRSHGYKSVPPGQEYQGQMDNGW
jgi:hypothetical protein